MIVEEGLETMVSVTDGAWVNEDGIADRHMKGQQGGGIGNIAFTDGHAGRVQPPAAPARKGAWASQYFLARTTCAFAPVTASG